MSLGIEFGRSAIKIVELRRGIRGVRLVGAARRRIARPNGPTGPRGTAELLRETLEGRATGKAAVIGLTGRQVNLQVRLFPASKLTSYASLIRNEVENLRAERPGEYVDFVTLRRPDSFFPNYLSMIGSAEGAFVQEHLDGVRASGRKVREVVPTPFALAAAYAHAYPGEGGVTMLVNLGAENTDMVLVRGGRLLFARNITQGANVFDEQILAAGAGSPEEAEYWKVRYGSLEPGGEDPKVESVRPAVRQAAWQLTAFLQSSLAYARRQLGEDDLSVDRVYASGGGMKVRGLLRYLESALKVPVKPMDPFRRIEPGGLTAEEIRERPSDLAVATGLAILGLEGSRHPKISLLPDAIRRRREHLRKTPFLAAAWGIALLAMGVVTVLLKERADAVEARARELEGERKRVESQAEELSALEAEFRRLYAKHDSLQAASSAGLLVLETYGRLRRRVTKQIQIERFELRDPKEEERVIANTEEQGHVVGPFGGEAEDEEFIEIAGVGKVPRKEAVRWTVSRPRLYVHGRIDENIRGGDPHVVLRELAARLTDPSQGIRCRLHWQGQSKVPGWRAFTLRVEVE